MLRYWLIWLSDLIILLKQFENFTVAIFGQNAHAMHQYKCTNLQQGNQKIHLFSYATWAHATTEAQAEFKKS